MKSSIRTNLQILTVAGYEGCQEREGGSNWQAWQADFSGPARSSTEHLAFLNANATWPDVERLEAWHRQKGIKQYSVIVRPGSSVADDLPRLRAQLGRESVKTASQFLFNVVRRGLGKPAAAGADFGIKYFVEPWLTVPDSGEPRPAISHLSQWIRGATPSSANVAVLLAPAGTGKTTVSTELFRRLGQQSQAEAVPLLVGRQQWAGLQQQYWMELADVWSIGVRTW